MEDGRKRKTLYFLKDVESYISLYTKHPCLDSKSSCHTWQTVMLHFDETLNIPQFVPNSNMNFKCYIHFVLPYKTNNRNFDRDDASNGETQYHDDDYDVYTDWCVFTVSL